MENNLENKARFLAQYWGQEVLADVNNNGDKVLYPIVVSNMYRIEESHLELTPLSEITDEDAIEVARIVHGRKDKVIEMVIDTPHGRHEACTYVLVQIFVDHPDIMEWKNFALIQIDHEEAGDVICGSMNESGDFEDDFIDNYIHVTDHLRSKKYALPFHDLSVDDLIEYGWVKFKTK